MKIFSFLNYDFEEGTVRYYLRYLLIIPFVIVTFIVFDKKVEYLSAMLDELPTSLEQGINLFYGRLPFNDVSSGTETFVVPFNWMISYLLLAVLIGSHLQDDMTGFGLMIMIHSKKRGLWWKSKCVWASIVCVIHFTIIWGVNVAYEWIRYGCVSFRKNYYMLDCVYGSELGATPDSRLYIMVFVMPLLVGIVQSLFQMVLSIHLNSGISLVIISSVLVLESYYSNKYMVHSYSMISRYYKNINNPGYVPVDLNFGLLYLVVLCLILVIIGDLMIKKKDIV